MKKEYKFFVVSDIHGEYDALMEALQEAEFDARNPQHFFVALGDSFDRGPCSRQIYDFFMSLNKDRSMFVKGNHDTMFLEYLKKGIDGEYVLFNILHNGLGATIGSFGHEELDKRAINMELLTEIRAYILEGFPKIIENIQTMPLWFETDHTIMVHAGLNPNILNWQDTDEHFALWDIENAHKKVHSTEKTIIFGHYHTKLVAEQAERAGDKAYNIKTKSASIKALSYKGYGNQDDYCIKYLTAANKIAIDGCTNLTGKVNVLVFNDTITVPEEGAEIKKEEPVISSIKIDNSNIIYTTTFGNYTITENPWL